MIKYTPSGVGRLHTRSVTRLDEYTRFTAAHGRLDDISAGDRLETLSLRATRFAAPA